MRIHYVVTDRAAENEVIKEFKPASLMCSYEYFKNKSLKTFTDKLGYVPRYLFLDSGAFTGKQDINKLIQYIKDNEPYIWRYACLDVIRAEGGDIIPDSEATYKNYLIMKEAGLNPVPVYHYKEPEEYLNRYIAHGETFIAIGGAKPYDKKTVAEWFKMVKWLNPGIEFHIFGSTSKKITDYCDVGGVDSSTWLLQAKNGVPKDVRGKDGEPIDETTIEGRRAAKIERMRFHMAKLEEYLMG